MKTLADPSTSSPSPPVEFTGSRQSQFFGALKRSRFSGQLIISDLKQQEWIFYFYLGHIMYATGGFHPVRRWKRALLAHCPQVQTGTLSHDLSEIQAHSPTVCWEYQLLCSWVEKTQLTYEQATNVIRMVMAEVLFDITRVMHISYRLKPDKSLSAKLILADTALVIDEAKDQWQEWQNAKVADRSPDSAPVIRDQEQLRQRLSANVYKTLIRSLDGHNTLRDLGIKMKRSAASVSKSLLPLMQLGLIELTEIPDLPAPNSPAKPPAQRQQRSSRSPLVACVDDSPSICQTMERIIVDAGYQVVTINDPLRAIALLLSRKPDIIFLDLVMPSANGYEICSQLRKLSYFRKTPIIILTGNDGVIDRVRSKLVGSTDFLSKPIDAGEVLGTVQRYLPELADPRA